MKSRTRRAVVLTLCLACVAEARAEPPRSPGVATRFFGLEARGKRVVYVCDRSASMGEPDGRPLAAAKAELIRSLDGLGDSQQFGIVFYNERQRVFSPTGATVRPMFASDESRRQARAFIEEVPAVGGTRHAEAIASALRIGADVVFVLTDADAEHDLSEGELRSLAGRPAAPASWSCSSGPPRAVAPRDWKSSRQARGEGTRSSIRSPRSRNQCGSGAACRSGRSVATASS